MLPAFRAIVLIENSVDRANDSAKQVIVVKKKGLDCQAFWGLGVVPISTNPDCS